MIAARLLPMLRRRGEGIARAGVVVVEAAATGCWTLPPRPTMWNLPVRDMTWHPPPRPKTWNLPVS